MEALSTLVVLFKGADTHSEVGGVIYWRCFKEEREVEVNVERGFPFLSFHACLGCEVLLGLTP